ncbi:eryA, partial [Symbiodinium necroappetens]
ACLLGRSKASPHRRAPEPGVEAKEEEEENVPVIQVDYCYTFTKRRHEVQEQMEGTDAGTDTDEKAFEEEAPNPEDYRDQFGLTLVAAESTTGWLAAVPVLQKGASALKRVTENLVRLSLQVSAAGEVAFQGDPEPSVKQILNSVVACRTKLGLKTKAKITQKGSHSSNGQVEKAIDTLRRSALTLKTFAEDRAKVVLEGDHHIFGWLLRHAAYLHNRFFTGHRGIPAYEAMFGRRFKANLLPFGELCIYHAPSKYKGDLQWQRGLFVGLNEKNGANIVLTPDGAREARSVRRLPEEQQWDAKALVTYRGLPWDYGGTKKRKRPLYTSARLPLLPDNATLEELAKAAGTAAAEAIAASTPKPNNNNDEAGSDSPTSSSTSSPSPGWWKPGGGRVVAEGGLLDDGEGPSWDEHGEHAPELSEDELDLVNAASDKTEIERLVAMGVMRKRPGWRRGSRLVAREFKAWTPWTQDLFAPASNLAAAHSFMTLALTFGLELVTIDVKDAYLNVPQPEPVVIEVEAALLNSSHRVGASAWYGFAKKILNDNGLVNFDKEPTVFRHEDPQDPTALLLHADDGLLAGTKKSREKLVTEMRKVVNVQVSAPMREVGNELEFLKRKYVRVPEGIIMYSSNRYAESLFETFGRDTKEKDALSLISGFSNCVLLQRSLCLFR